MAADDIETLVEKLRGLRPDQAQQVGAYIRLLSEPPDVTCSNTGFATEAFVHRLGDTLRFHHHLFSHEPFTKDKFEHAMVAALNQTGHNAELAAKNNPGHDLTVDGERWSLKTQANQGIKRDSLHISKFMELGKGKWDTQEDLGGLRDQMLHHLASYDRVFSLRCFRTPLVSGISQYEYELVEIPKALLEQARGAKLRLVTASAQSPKPGYGEVASDRGLLLFNLYFDGGSERKLQIKDLSKALCTVHATWKVTVKQ